MRRGLSIPGDLSVVGYDDSPLASQLWPALTTIRLPIRDLGRQAAQMLLADEPAPDEAPRARRAWSRRSWWCATPASAAGLTRLPFGQALAPRRRSLRHRSQAVALAAVAGATAAFGASR